MVNLAYFHSPQYSQHSHLCFSTKEITYLLWIVSNSHLKIVEVASFSRRNKRNQLQHVWGDLRKAGHLLYYVHISNILPKNEFGFGNSQKCTDHEEFGEPSSDDTVVFLGLSFWQWTVAITHVIFTIMNGVYLVPVLMLLSWYMSYGNQWHYSLCQNPHPPCFYWDAHIKIIPKGRYTASYCPLFYGESIKARTQEKIWVNINKNRGVF